MNRLTTFFPFLCAAVLAAGCARAEDGAVPDVEADLARPEVEFDESVIYSLFEKVDGLLTAGDTNEATHVFVEAVDDPEFAPVHTQLFATLMRYLLFTGQIEDAKAKYLAALRTEPESTLPARDFIYGFLLNEGDIDGALDWARTLMAQDLPPDVRAAASEWLATGLLSKGDRDGAFAAVSSAVAEFAPAVAAPLAHRFAQGALAHQDVALAESVVSLLSSRSEVPEFAAAANGLELRILAAKGDFATAIARIPALFGVLPDGQFVQGINELFRAADAVGKTDAIDLISSAVVLDERFAEYPATRLVAARRWLGVVFAGEPDGKALYPQRFDKLLKMQFKPDHLYSLYARYFYDVMDDPEILRETAAIGKLLRAQVPDQAEADALKSYELDADFILGDYDGALSVIDEGIPDHDAAWHQMTRAKILAHKALADGDRPGAVARFREFLELLPDEDQHDPTTGIVFSRDALIGLNEKRIGDIWAEAGDAAKAAEAYTAARAAYEKAIEKNQAGSETKNFLEARIAEIPAAPVVKAPGKPEVPEAPVTPTSPEKPEETPAASEATNTPAA